MQDDDLFIIILGIAAILVLGVVTFYFWQASWFLGICSGAVTGYLAYCVYNYYKAVK